MKRESFATILVLILASGCGGKELSLPAAPAQKTGGGVSVDALVSKEPVAPPPSPATAGGSPASVEKSEPEAPVQAENPPEDEFAEKNNFLTYQLEIFLRDYKRMPKDFGEFANARLDSVPQPPPGKKWVIDESKKQIKAVRK
jgi:hypothetical protein